MPPKAHRIAVTPKAAKHTILHVDDDDASAYLFFLAVEESGCSATVHRVRDGDEAMEVLGDQDPNDVFRPDLIVLDLNMPMMDGWEVLNRLRSRGELHNTSVVVLSTSEAANHQTRALELGASEFITKPLLIEDLYSLAKTLSSRYLLAPE